MNTQIRNNSNVDACRRTLILCDFDGTVSTADTVNRVIRSHVISPEWRFPVKQYLRGDIGSKGVYEAVAPLMRMNREEYRSFALRHASLDPDFPRFLGWARERGIDVKILSDGFDLTIHTLFDHHGIKGVEVFANRLVIHNDGSVEILSPHADPSCGMCGTCKLKVLQSFRPEYDRIILVGDGESDRHAARHADMVLALRDLFIFCCSEGIPAMRIEGFGEVPELLSRRIQAVTFDMDGTLLDSLVTIADAFNHMFARLGYPTMTVDEVARKTCISLVDFVHSYLKPEEAEIGIKIFREYYDTIFLDKTTLMPGAKETLDAIDGTVVAGIVTNKRGQYARLLAEHFGFADRMARIIGAQDGFHAKPSGEMFDEFARFTGVDKSAMIYVGDSPIDVEAARNGGIDAFVVANSVFSAQELALCKPRRVLARITDLPAALESLVPE
ncbi:MAG: HAD family hydrolase [Desulfomonile sp.]|nr:HAD family hydrolase [Desulfomonile sp.]